MDFGNLSENLARVLEQIADVQAREGLKEDVKIVAVTKGHSSAAVSAAHAVGIQDVGENRVQEALGKQDVTASLPMRWHLIGHLQKNKAKFVPGRFHAVHSLDSVRLAHALQLAMENRAAGTTVDVLVQVNVAKESQKSGCEPEELGEIAGRILESPALRLRGLMTMAPFTEDERILRRTFSGTREALDRCATELGFAGRTLSMGMSNDFEIAVEEGSTELRLGTVLLGERAVQ